MQKKMLLNMQVREGKGIKEKESMNGVYFFQLLFYYLYPNTQLLSQPQVNLPNAWGEPYMWQWQQEVLHFLYQQMGVMKLSYPLSQSRTQMANELHTLLTVHIH